MSKFEHEEARTAAWACTVVFLEAVCRYVELTGKDEDGEALMHAANQVRKEITPFLRPGPLAPPRGIS